MLQVASQPEASCFWPNYMVPAAASPRDCDVLQNSRYDLHNPSRTASYGKYHVKWATVNSRWPVRRICSRCYFVVIRAMSGLRGGGVHARACLHVAVAG